MIVQSFRSVLWVGAVAGAAISCYMVSLRVAAERAALERVETRILLAKRDIRALDTELTTRGRLRQLERWNSDVLALTAPTEGQFLEGEVQLASLGRAETRGTLGDAPGPAGVAEEPFMHAVAGPPPAPEPRPILADYKPAAAPARLVKANAVRDRDADATARKRSPAPKSAARDGDEGDARPPAPKASADRKASGSNKKAKAKTTT